MLEPVGDATRGSAVQADEDDDDDDEDEDEGE